MACRVVFTQTFETEYDRIYLEHIFHQSQDFEALV